LAPPADGSSAGHAAATESERSKQSCLPPTRRRPSSRRSAISRHHCPHPSGRRASRKVTEAMAGDEPEQVEAPCIRGQRDRRGVPRIHPAVLPPCRTSSPPGFPWLQLRGGEGYSGRSRELQGRRYGWMPAPGAAAIRADGRVMDAPANSDQLQRTHRPSATALGARRVATADHVSWGRPSSRRSQV